MVNVYSVTVHSFCISCVQYCVVGWVGDCVVIYKSSHSMRNFSCVSYSSKYQKLSSTWRSITSHKAWILKCLQVCTVLDPRRWQSPWSLHENHRSCSKHKIWCDIFVEFQVLNSAQWERELKQLCMKSLQVFVCLNHQRLSDYQNCYKMLYPKFYHDRRLTFLPTDDVLWLWFVCRYLNKSNWRHLQSVCTLCCLMLQYIFLHVLA